MDLREAKWRKSSRSGNVGACVEVAVLPGRGDGTGAGAAALRDSKNPDGGVLLVPLVAIRTLLTRL